MTPEVVAGSLLSNMRLDGREKWGMEGRRCLGNPVVLCPHLTFWPFASLSVCTLLVASELAVVDAGQPLSSFLNCKLLCIMC